jgi:hypothetical protein
VSGVGIVLVVVLHVKFVDIVVAPRGR